MGPDVGDDDKMEKIARDLYVDPLRASGIVEALGGALETLVDEGKTEEVSAHDIATSIRSMNPDIPYSPLVELICEVVSTYHERSYSLGKGNKNQENPPSEPE